MYCNAHILAWCFMTNSIVLYVLWSRTRDNNLGASVCLNLTHMCQPLSYIYMYVQQWQMLGWLKDTCRQCIVACISVILCCVWNQEAIAFQDWLLALNFSADDTTIGHSMHVSGTYLNGYMHADYSGHWKPCKILTLTSKCLFQGMWVLVHSGILAGWF